MNARVQVAETYACVKGRECVGISQRGSLFQRAARMIGMVSAKTEGDGK